MGKPITLDTELLDRQYQQTLDIIYLKYHCYPKPYPEINLSEQDERDLAYISAVANAYAQLQDAGCC